MAVTIADIQKLRKMTGAGLADCKKALTEADGDIEKAIELVRERGLAIAAKRSDRETSNGCVLVKSVDGFAAMVAVKCETDFVAAGKEFIDMTAEILDAAIAAKAQSLDDVKKLVLASGDDAETAVKHRSGITGEKMELDGYNFLEGDNISVYDHMGKHTLCTMVQLNENNEEAGHKVAMQVAAMRPVALDEVKALKVGESDAQAAVTQRSGITGEKMELDGYCVLEGDNIEVYDHMNKHTLCTMVQLNENNEEAGHKIAMQVAAMRPVALDESSVSEETKKTELEVAVAKTKEELVEKAVNAALKKAGINPAHVDSEDHIESNTKKGWLTPEQAEEARNIKKTVGEEKAASLNPTMIQNIANGRLAKFFKENCLVDQEFQFGDGDKQTVAQYLASQSKDLKIVAYQRFTLAAE